jgi:hypothetical protein
MSASVRRPVRFSAIFGQMLQECPAQIASYGGCVSAHLGKLEKDVCSAEFAVLKACSERALTKLRRSR